MYTNKNATSPKKAKLRADSRELREKIPEAPQLPDFPSSGLSDFPTFELSTPSRNSQLKARSYLKFDNLLVRFVRLECRWPFAKNDLVDLLSEGLFANEIAYPIRSGSGDTLLKELV
jgi:hypothetical protein